MTAPAPADRVLLGAARGTRPADVTGPVLGTDDRVDGVNRGPRNLVRYRWRRLSLLVVLCAVPAGVEAGLSEHVGHLGPTSYISPQASALWPYDTFHDVRWVMVYHRSWPGFVGESVAAIVLRGLFCTVLTALAWPAQSPRPPLRRLAARNLVFAAALGAFLSPWAAMSVVVADVSLVWYLLGAIVPVLVMAPFLQRGAIVPGWWRGLPPVGTVVLSILNFVTLTLGGAAVAATPANWRTATATLVGGANGLLWDRAVRTAVLVRPVHWRQVPATPVVAAIVVVVMFASGRASLLRMELGRETTPPAISDVETRVMHRPVIFLAGYDSRYSGEPSGASLPVVRYSYRGLHPDGRPRPYNAQDTHQSLDTSAALLATQVDRMHRITGQKVAVLAESEGTLITRYYLRTRPHQAVDTVALLSPVLRAGRVYYPPRDRSAGWGVATGWQLRAIFAVLGAGRPIPNVADQPLVRSILDNAPLFRGRQMLCPVDGIRIVAFLPTLDGLANPPEPASDGKVPVINVDGVHGLLIDDPLAQQRLVDFLNGQPDGQHRSWDYVVAQYAGAAWQTPALRVQFNPVWRTVGGRSTRDFDRNVCL